MKMSLGHFTPMAASSQGTPVPLAHCHALSTRRRTITAGKNPPRDNRPNPYSDRYSSPPDLHQGWPATTSAGGLGLLGAGDNRRCTLTFLARQAASITSAGLVGVKFSCDHDLNASGPRSSRPTFFSRWFPDQKSTGSVNWICQ